MSAEKKILAAVGLDADTEKVLAYALWLAEAWDSGKAGIDMLHVMDYALTPPAYLIPYIEKEKISCQEALGAWKQKLEGFGIRAGFRIAVGRLIEAFNRAVKELGAEVMVLGYKSHMIRPSSSERLIKSVAVPMLIVRGRKSEAAALNSVDIKRILCAVDFSDSSKRAVDFARTLSGLTASSLIITHAVSSLRLEESFRRLKELSAAEKEQYRDYVLREAEEDICSLLRVCSGAENVVRIGVPYKVINETAAERDADLIIMGARGLSYTKGVLLGGTAESVVKSSPCPLMIIH